MVNDFKKAICEKTGARFAIAVSSGTSALHLACMAAGLGKGHRAITSPITFIATSNAVLYCGAKPIFADIEDSSMNLDPLQVEKKITKRTKAIIPVHFAGHACEVEAFEAISNVR